jgi:hypothetical protein
MIKYQLPSSARARSCLQDQSRTLSAEAVPWLFTRLLVQSAIHAISHVRWHLHIRLGQLARRLSSLTSLNPHGGR